MLILKKVNYLWRLFATGLCFLLFSIGSLILGYLIIPSVIAISTITKSKKSKKHIVQYCIYLTFRYFTQTLSCLGLVDYQFNGFEKLQQDQGTLFLANHPTLIDYVLIVSKLPCCDNIVKASLWQNRFVRKVISDASYIPNINPEQTFDGIKNTLSKGNNLLLFPEGTRSSPNKPITLKRGAAQIALRANAPIRVIYITCIPSTLAKNDKWYKIPAKKPVFTLTVGDLIDPYLILQQCNGLPSVAARRLTKILEEQLQGK
ncbi:lysophospholipid acyltransferase family protein [Fastidiosibacter lacustris]|uniref:lysophospholipid acyltransferase family protein n=1 Tax=Fastidiosibacter lacustris TaxID=2056695 RepID=UPI001EFC31CE|nr:lysophospholipid acyltransferase family protein [Fastidiosibacter lacustris]